MSKSLWKFSFSNYKLLLFLYKNKKSNSILFYNLILLPIFLNKSFNLYNGCKFFHIKIYEKMVGLRIKNFLILKNKLNGKNKKRN